MWLHPQIRTLPDIARHWSRQAPEKVALRCGDVALSYRELDARTSRFGKALVDHGADRANICFIGKNVPEFWIAWLGAGKAGARFTPLNWRCAAPELAEVIDDADPRVIVTHREYARLIADALGSTRRTPEVVVFDSLADGGAGLEAWCGDSPAEDPAVPTTGEDIALIAYTSGTTGRPKGVMIRHEAFDLFQLSDELEPTIDGSPTDVNLMVMPNFHLAGSWVSLPTLYHGGTVAMIPAFEPDAVLEAIEANAVTTLCLVPTAIQALLAADRTASADLSSLRTLIYAGSPIPAETIDRALAVLGCELRQFYGTTETYIITILRPADHRAPDPEVKASCGAPVPLVSVRVVGPDDEDLAAGEVGQVLVRSPMVMAGYLNQPEETARVLQDGWYATGDLGYRTADGLLVLVDRAKDMVVTGGENVYSVEVERALHKHPAVALAAVVGTPDRRWGEAVAAYVVPRAGVSTEGLADELARHCRELIAAYKVPKQIYIEESLPMTPMGKVRKVDLRARAVNAANEPGEEPR